jgi:DNA polymerase-1
VLDAFESKGLGEEVAIENARLARILRDGEYNFETKEVKLWAA